MYVYTFVGFNLHQFCNCSWIIDNYTEKHSFSLDVWFSFGTPSQDLRKGLFVLRDWKINISFGLEGFLFSMGHLPKTRTCFASLLVVLTMFSFNVYLLFIEKDLLLLHTIAQMTDASSSDLGFATCPAFWWFFQPE